jgi:hypothetical protein
MDEVSIYNLTNLTLILSYFPDVDVYDYIDGLYGYMHGCIYGIWNNIVNLF